MEICRSFVGWKGDINAQALATATLGWEVHAVDRFKVLWLVRQCTRAYLVALLERPKFRRESCLSSWTKSGPLFRARGLPLESEL